jgi:hypothetical protein
MCSWVVISSFSFLCDICLGKKMMQEQRLNRGMLRTGMEENQHLPTRCSWALCMPYGFWVLQRLGMSLQSWLAQSWLALEREGTWKLRRHWWSVTFHYDFFWKVPSWLHLHPVQGDGSEAKPQRDRLSRTKKLFCGHLRLKCHSLNSLGNRVWGKTHELMLYQSAGVQSQGYESEVLEKETEAGTEE